MSARCRKKWRQWWRSRRRQEGLHLLAGGQNGVANEREQKRANINYKAQLAKQFESKTKIDNKGKTTGKQLQKEDEIDLFSQS